MSGFLTLQTCLLTNLLIPRRRRLTFDFIFPHTPAKSDCLMQEVLPPFPPLPISAASNVMPYQVVNRSCWHADVDKRNLVRQLKFEGAKEARPDPRELLDRHWPCLCWAHK